MDRMKISSSSFESRIFVFPRTTSKFVIILSDWANDRIFNWGIENKVDVILRKKSNVVTNITNMLTMLLILNFTNHYSLQLTGTETKNTNSLIEKAYWC